MKEFALTFNQIHVIQLLETLIGDQKRKGLLAEDQLDRLMMVLISTCGKMMMNLQNPPTCILTAAKKYISTLTDTRSYHFEPENVRFTMFNVHYYECMFQMFALAHTFAPWFAEWGHRDLVLLMNEDFHNNEVSGHAAVQIPLVNIG